MFHVWAALPIGNYEINDVSLQHLAAPEQPVHEFSIDDRRFTNGGCELAQRNTGEKNKSVLGIILQKTTGEKNKSVLRIILQKTT